MFVNIATLAAACALIVPSLATPQVSQAPAQQPTNLAKRCGGCGGWGNGCGGCGGWGCGSCGGWGRFPFASSATNALNTNCNKACCNDDTLYVNHKNGNSACNNVNNFANANVIA
ncbi:hypothetical protein GGH12_001377 [Coemansia sp. RSA 1822]|nr:hypothetical protein LPJ76_006412 [Coemansia sp. RSA 638]KAJ2565454.1 hypothetical protein GGH12_001377 [Coemansia sp. RSA 1822]